MALRSTQDLYCPVCFDPFRDPVLLSCSHSFCRACLQSWWTEKGVPECPVCKRRSSKEDPPRNLVLRNLCETFSEELSLKKNSSRPDDICSQHKEKLRLFCLEHQQLICLVCRDSKVHRNHTIRPVDEAAQDSKHKVRESLKLLQTRLEEFSQAKAQVTQTALLIDEQGRRTERLIQAEFNRMRLFLQKEEQACIRDLKAEVLLKRNSMDQKLATLTREMDALSESIRQTEKELQSQDILTFLQNYSASLKRVQLNPSTIDPDVPWGSLVDVAKHLGNLGFRIWSKMKEHVTYTPVVLDPNTASLEITVSDDLRCITYGTQTLPDNPERFRYYMTVLGSKVCLSGTHSWEVEVPNDADWAVGVIAQSFPRKEKHITSGRWIIRRRKGEYVAFAPSLVDQVLCLKRAPRIIRVDLDCGRRTVLFSDSRTNTHYYTFTNVFSERLYPCFGTISQKQMKILPVELSVQKGLCCL